MSLFTPRRSLLAVSDNAAALLGPGAAPEQARIERIDFADPPRAQRALAELLSAASTRLIDIVLHDRLVRYFTLTPPEGVLGLNELESAARLRLCDLFSVDDAAWQLHGDWKSDKPFLCCALPRTVSACFARAARAAGKPLASAAPLFVRVCNRIRFAGNSGRWAACRHDGWSTVAFFGNGGCHYIRSSALAMDRPLSDSIKVAALRSGLTQREAWVLDADVDTGEPDDALTGLRHLDGNAPDVRLLKQLSRATAAA